MLDAQEYAQRLTPLLRQAAGYARSILRDRHLAEDAVQQAALKAWERIDTFDSTRPFKGWWFAILRNGCLDMLRTRRHVKEVGFENFDPPAEDATFDWEQLSSAMQRLSAEHRDILRLKYFTELSYNELAAALDIPRGTVMSRLYLARQALAKHLHEEAR